MAAADDGALIPDLYRLLGVSRKASGEEITQAWRRRALTEHPDLRPRDAAAPARFRALAEAYRVLGDPARRAAYDRSPAGPTGPDAAVPAGSSLGGPGGVRPAGRIPEPPLRAGPVWVDVPRPSAASRAAEDDAVGLAALVELVARHLAGDEGWPW